MRYVRERKQSFGVGSSRSCARWGCLRAPTTRAGTESHRRARALRDAELVAEIHRAREGYRRAYGVRKTWRELSRRGVEVGRDRVTRLMRAEGLEGVRRGRRQRTTTPAETAADRARDLVGRDFTAAGPNELWVADITYLRTFSGYLYLAFILGCLQPHDRPLADRRPHAHRAGARCARDGRWAAPARRRAGGALGSRRIARVQGVVATPPC